MTPNAPEPGGDDRLPAVIVAAVRGDAEVTLYDLFSILGMPTSEPILTKLQLTLKFMEQYGFAMIPSLDTGDLTTTRRLCLRTAVAVTVERMRDEVKNGEGARLEFKSSLQYDHQKARNYPGAPLGELRSDSVVHACLKTIAAFLNSEGGVLYVGVEDSGTIIGLAEDLLALKKEKRTSDSWELMFRDMLRARFKDGDTINDYVRVQFIDCESKLVARVEVYRRSRLSFLKYQEKCFLYRRQGNRTAEVTIDQVEEFLAQRGV